MLKLFSFLRNKKDIFGKDNSCIIFAIYSDKIEAFLLKKNKEFSLEFIGAEAQEGLFSVENPDMNKLKLNCSKLKVKITEKNLNTKNIIFGVSSEILKPIFASKSLKRKNSEKKIKEDEIEKIIFNLHKEFKKKDRTLFLKKAEKYFVDGYKIENPVGFSGQNLRIDSIGFESKIDLNKILNSLSKFLLFEFQGVFALDTVLLFSEKEFREVSNAVFINILSGHISIFLIKKASVSAIDNIDFGYSSFEQKISKELSVGIEEARAIKDKFLNGNLDVNLMDKLRNIAFLEAESILNMVRKSLLALDQTSLLPKTLFVAFFGKAPLQLEQAFKKGNNWFSDLPFPQDIDIIFLNSIDMSAIINKRPDLSKINKAKYIGILVDNILKNINNFK